MNPRCPVCDLDFEPSAGYFMGAMYVSYAMGVLTVLPVAMALILFLDLSAAIVLSIALVQTLAMMLFMFRASRVAWLHIDQAFDPR